MLSRSSSSTTNNSAPPRPPPSSSVNWHPESRGALDSQRSFGRRTTSFGSTSFPTNRLSPVQIFILEPEPVPIPAVGREAYPRPIDQWQWPRLLRTTEASSRPYSSHVDQNRSLESLRKELYNPSTKRITTKVNLYYRDTPVNPKEVDHEEDGKRCAICLEDFDRGQEVMLTPCKHMFHEECIVPWAKSKGQCPVCRLVFGPRAMDNSNTNAPNMATPALSAQEFLSIVRALGDGFEWGH